MDRPALPFQSSPGAGAGRTAARRSHARKKTGASFNPRPALAPGAPRPQGRLPPSLAEVSILARRWRRAHWGNGDTARSLLLVSILARRWRRAHKKYALTPVADGISVSILARRWRRAHRTPLLPSGSGTDCAFQSSPGAGAGRTQRHVGRIIQGSAVSILARRWRRAHGNGDLDRTGQRRVSILARRWRRAHSHKHNPMAGHRIRRRMRAL